MADGTIELKVSDDDEEVGYVTLPAHPGSGTKGIVKKTVAVSELVDGYRGPDVMLDFDADGVLIGIEIVG